MINNRTLEIIATWHEDENIWVATSDDLPGLVTEAPDFEKLRRRLALLIPELLADLAEDGHPNLPQGICDFDVRQSIC